MTYTELVAQIADWLHRQDLAAPAPTFIQLAEERINRDLRINAFSAIAQVSIGVGQRSVDLPADYQEGRALVGTDSDWQQVTPEKMAQLWAAGSTDSYYAVMGGKLYIPYTATADVDLTLTYWTKVPALSSSNASNWLSANHPGVYLWCALAEAAIYAVKPQQGAVYENRATQAIASLRAAEQAASYFSAALTGDYVA